MANKKIVIKNPHLTLAGTPIGTQCNEISWTLERELLDTSCFGDEGESFEKGVYKGNKVTLKIKPDKDRVLENLILEEFLGDAATPMVVRDRDELKAADNPEWQFSVMIINPGDFGAARGQVREISVSWSIDGAIVRDDATTVRRFG